MAMLLTERKALEKPSVRETSKLLICRPAATSPTVMSVATVMETQAAGWLLVVCLSGSPGEEGSLHAIDIQPVYFIVRGRFRNQKTARPTTAQTIVQVELSVRVLRQIVQVRICDPATKTWKST